LFKILESLETSDEYRFRAILGAGRGCRRFLGGGRGGHVGRSRLAPRNPGVLALVQFAVYAGGGGPFPT